MYDLGHFRTMFWLNASSPQTLTLSLQNAATAARRSEEGSDSEKSNLFENSSRALLLRGFDEAAFEDIFDLLPKPGCAAYIFMMHIGQR